MKIYFSASRYYKKDYVSSYKRIVDLLNKGGYEVSDSSNLRLASLGERLSDKEKVDLYTQMEKMMDKSEVCVFEASYPSTIHIGHEITLAMTKNKPVVVFFAKGREPLLFRGLKEDKVYWVEYEAKNIEKKFREVMELANKNIDVRFNFFVSPKILNYLDWVSKNRMVPRSVFLRELIEKEMKKDKDFRG